MSYILEALKKSEQERHIGQVPDISAVQEAAVARAPRWPRLVLGALVINAIVIAVIVWRPWDERAVTTQTAPSPPDTPLQSRTHTAAPEPAAIAPIQREEMDPQRMEPATPTPMTPPPPAVAQEPTIPVAAPESPEDGVVRWQDLPAEERNRLPVPRIDVHVFATDPARRFVLVNLRKYQEGETLDQGVKLDTISADGIVLSYHGQRYRVDRP